MRKLVSIGDVGVKRVGEDFEVRLVGEARHEALTALFYREPCGYVLCDLRAWNGLVTLAHDDVDWSRMRPMRPRRDARKGPRPAPKARGQAMCEVCGTNPVQIREVGMCGPCATGEADSFYD